MAKEKDNIGTIFKWSIISLLVIIGLFILNKGVKQFSAWFKEKFGGEPTDEELGNLDSILNVSYNENELTISESDAEQRAAKIYTAQSGWGTDEVAIMQALIKSQFANEVKEFDQKVKQLPSGIREELYLKTYKGREWAIALSKDDLILIAHKYGLKKFGAIDQENFTLPQSINYEDDGYLSDVVTYMYQDTGIMI